MLNFIEKEQLRQQERKDAKKTASNKRKKESYFKSLNKKKNINPDIISAADYKKLNDDSAKRKADQRAWEWFSRYIRLRDLQVDKNGKIFGVCIACQKVWEVEFYSDGSIMNPNLWCASHYFLADQYASVRFNEDNVSLSCYRCNKQLSGNLALYKINLIKKIGQKRFELLEYKKDTAQKFNILDLIKIKEESMRKCKLEIERLGIRL